MTRPEPEELWGNTNSERQMEAEPGKEIEKNPTAESGALEMKGEVSQEGGQGYQGQKL